MTKKIILESAHPLSRARAEAFAQALARGAAPNAAAKAAGYVTPDYGAILARRPAIAARVAFLGAFLAGGGSRDTSSLIDQLIEIAKSARAQDDPRALSVARACLVDAAKLKQQLPAEATAVDDAEAAILAELDRTMSDEEWIRLYGPDAPGGRVGDGQ